MFLPMQPFQTVVSPSASAIAGWMTSGNPSMPHAAVAQGPPGLVQPPSTGGPRQMSRFFYMRYDFELYVLN